MNKGGSMARSTAGKKKKSELITTQWKYNNNKQNIVIFIRNWKVYNKIKLPIIIIIILVSFCRRHFNHFYHLILQKKKVPFSMAIGKGELQEWNKIKKQTAKVRRETWVWKEVKQARRKQFQWPVTTIKIQS